METSKEKSNHKILLMLLPFWTPLIPPLGISCLKAYLRYNNYDVKTYDANTEEELWSTYYKYFGVLKKYVAENKRGNFYNTGTNVLRNHAMAYINKTNEKDYMELIQTIIFQYFYVSVNQDCINELEEIIGKFYANLEQYLLNILEENKPSVVGLSVYSGTFAPSMFAFKLIKEKFPSIKTVMGGGIFSDQLSVNSPNFNAFIDRSNYIDKIIVGEGEKLFLRLLKGQLPDNKKVYTLADIGNEVMDISKMMVPDLSDFDIDKYPQITSFASRSCPFQCNFCSETVQWGKYRKKSAIQIVNELIRLYDKYNYQLFLLGDSLLNPVVTDLSEEISKRGLSLYWDGYLRADKDVCNIENTLLWRKGGFYRARLGVESGSQRVLDLMHKKISVEQIKSALFNLSSVGIKTTTYWVIGYPGETEEDFQNTLNIIEELKDYIYEAECNPFNYFLSGQVGSDIFNQKYKPKTLFEPRLADMLITQTWILDAEPSRKVTYDRVCRFANHCRKLGVPNPYTIKEIDEADQRWIRLHKNAVPSLLQFKSKSKFLDENKFVNEVLLSEDVSDSDSDFNF